MKPVFNSGLDEAVDVLEFVFNLRDAVDKAKEDGKVDLRDAYLVFPLIEDAQEAYEDIAAVPKAWKLATDEEKEKVYQYFAERFDLPNDVVEMKVEKAVRAGYLLIDVFL